MLKKKDFWSNRLSSVRSRVQPLTKKVQLAARQLENCSDHELKNQACRIREQASSVRATGDSLPLKSLCEALPAICEAIRRTVGFCLYPVQIQATMATASGNVIEMQTGEGKTVVTAAAAIVRALHGFSCHVATTNDYLAQRDYESLQPAFDRLGIGGGLLPPRMDKIPSRNAYDSEITYGPGYQFGFDFLYDQLTLRTCHSGSLGQSVAQQVNGFELDSQLVQCCQLDTIIVDEADSVLVDEATTPLILSFDEERLVDPRAYRLAMKVAHELTEPEHFVRNIQKKTIEISASGEEKIRQSRVARQLQLERPWKNYVRSALHAEHFLLRDENYVVRNGKVQIVDQFTGRIFEDRRWQAGLHQAVEMKEGVEITPPRVSKARITRQRLISFYNTLCGLSGTALGAARDFRQFYQVGVVPIPTHFPCQRQLFAPRFFADQSAKFKAIASEVSRRHRTGQPILIGTQTIRTSLEIDAAISSLGLETVVLNGVQDQEEAEIVAAAGEAGSITIATNMAGRGTDIKLSSESEESGGLHVIGVGPNQSQRIDRQLIGRSARQGQPGSAQFFISADDELLSKYAPQLSQRIAKSARSDGEARINAAASIRQIQNRVEQVFFQRRMEMVMHDHWMDSILDTIFGETVDV